MQGSNCEVQWLGTAEEHRAKLENSTVELMNGGSVTAFGMTITAADVVRCARSFEAGLDDLFCKMAMGCELAADQVKLVLTVYGRSLVFGLLRLHERWETYDHLIRAAGEERTITIDINDGITITAKQDRQGGRYFLASTRTAEGRVLLAEGKDETEAYLQMVELIEYRITAVRDGKVK